MPLKAKHPCAHPNCPATLRHGAYCPEHQRQREHDLYVQRPERDGFYQSARWRRFRKLILAEQPICVACEASGRVVPATDVDHIEPRLARPDLAFEPTNCQALCHGCHSRKTRREALEGGYRSVSSGSKNLQTVAGPTYEFPRNWSPGSMGGAQ